MGTSEERESSYRVDALIARDIDAYLHRHQHKSLLRFITCGSVDDGKSTLIGRLLYDSKMIFEDQLAALEADSKKIGTQGQEIDFALLVDGLAAEREQGITIDVAYRFFSTEKRKFIVADTPGHEQYTRNMVTGASTAELAVILVDARKGVLTQTRRHSYLAHLIGIRNLVLAINKMDRRRLSRVRRDDRHHRLRAHADLGLQGRQRDDALDEHALVSRADVDGAPRDGRAGRDARPAQALSHAGAVGQPSEPRFPRLLRSDLERRDRAGRCDPRASLGQDERRHPHRDVRR
jgi:small GTP-binding protein